MKRLFNLATTLWLITLTTLSAQQMQEEDQDNRNREVFLSCPSYCFDVDFTALYLQPTGSNLHYAAQADPLPLPTPHWIIHDIKPEYHFGFDIGASLINRERSTRASLNWTHFCSKDHASKNAGSNDMIGPFFEIGPDAAPYTKAKGHVHFQYDAVNLDYGICASFGDHLHTNFFAGVGGARIEQKLTGFYSNADGTIARTIKTPSTFTGAGPQFGIDFAYNICEKLNLTGGGTGTLLIGDLKNHTSYSSISPFLAPLGITPPNKQSTTVHKRTGMVPSFEGRLGLSYDFQFCNCYVNLEAGYEARIYINAIQSVDMGSEVVTPPVAPDAIGVFARTFQRNLSNFGLSGPYLKLNVAF